MPNPPAPQVHSSLRLWQGVALVVLTLAGWSSVPLFIRHFSHSIDIWTSNGWRYGFSALLWAPVLIISWLRGQTQGERETSNRVSTPGVFSGLPEGLWKAAVLPALFNSVGQVAFAWSFYNVDAATATFGLRMQIVFLAVGAYLLVPSERPVLRSPVSWLGIAMVLGGIIGTVVLSEKTAGNIQVVSGAVSPQFGAGLAIFGGLCFAGYALSVRRNMTRFHPVTAFAAISQYTALVMVVLMLILARNPKTALPDFGYSAWEMGSVEVQRLLLSAVIGIALGHVFYYMAIARLGVAVTGAVLQLQPFIVAVAQAILFGIMLTTGQWISGSCAVLGAMLLLSVQWKVHSAAMARQRMRLPAE